MFNQLKMNLWIYVFEFINLVENYIMRYLFVFLLLGLFVSCESDASQNENARLTKNNGDSSKEEEGAQSTKKKSACECFQKTDYPAGEIKGCEWVSKSAVQAEMLKECPDIAREIGLASVKIENLEIMAMDMGVMEWGEGFQTCEALGDGWRLPTTEELNLLLENQDKFCCAPSTKYGFWSSTENDCKSNWNKGYEGEKLNRSRVWPVRDIL